MSLQAPSDLLGALHFCRARLLIEAPQSLPSLPSRRRPLCLKSLARHSQAIRGLRSVSHSGRPKEIPSMTTNLEHHRQTLRDMRRRVTGKLEHVAESIREDSNPAGSLSHAPVHLADAAQDIVADVEILATEHDILRKIDDALARLDDGSYGKCVQCGQRIGRERIAAVPYAALCIHCARKNEG